MKTALLLSAVIARSPIVFGTETDQFTTPKVPLYDIGPDLSRKVVEIIESDRTGRDPERILFEWVGRNVFSSRIVKWVKGIQKPDAPTIRVHGYYIGTDKIDHFFQQGHGYATASPGCKPPALPSPPPSPPSLPTASNRNTNTSAPSPVASIPMGIWPPTTPA